MLLLGPSSLQKRHVTERRFYVRFVREMPIASNNKKRIRKLLRRGQKELKDLAHLSKWCPLLMTRDPRFSNAEPGPAKRFL